MVRSRIALKGSAPGTAGSGGLGFIGGLGVCDGGAGVLKDQGFAITAKAGSPGTLGLSFRTTRGSQGNHPRGRMGLGEAISRGLHG